MIIDDNVSESLKSMFVHQDTMFLMSYAGQIGFMISIGRYPERYLKYF